MMCDAESSTGKEIWVDLPLYARLGVLVWITILQLVGASFAVFAAFMIGQMLVLGMRALLVRPTDSLDLRFGLFLGFPIALLFLAVVGWFSWKQWARLYMSMHLPSARTKSEGRVPAWAVASKIEAIDLLYEGDFPTHALPRERRIDL
jgi:hypothetical protein